MFHLPLLWDVCYSLFSHLFFAENGAKQLCREDYFTNPQYTPSFSFRDFWTAALVVWFLHSRGRRIAEVTRRCGPDRGIARVKLPYDTRAIHKSIGTDNSPTARSARQVTACLSASATHAHLLCLSSKNGGPEIFFSDCQLYRDEVQKLGTGRCSQR